MNRIRDSYKAFSARLIRLFRKSSGQSLVIAALTLPVVAGMGAMAVDVGYTYVARGALQNASDAGARAGAAVLATGGTQAAASAAALNIVNQNIASNAFLAGANPVVSFPTATSVNVTINDNLPLFFAPVIGINSAAVNATASAGISSVSSVPPGSLVPLAVYCNNPNGCAGVLSVGQTLTLRRYCGNYFADGPNGNSCGSSISNGENFLVGITFDNNNSNAQFRSQVSEGYEGEVSYGQMARALPGNRNGWRSGMTSRLAEGRNEMTLAVIRELNPSQGNYNIEIADLIQVRVTDFQTQGNTDQTTFEITRTISSGTNFSAAGQGLGINSVVGVRMTQ